MPPVRPAPRPDQPIARFGGRLATGLCEVTHDPAALESEGWWAVAYDFEGRLTCARFAEVHPDPVPAPAADRWRGPSPDSWRSSLDRAGYLAGVRRIREHIAAGEVYQANLCRVMTAPLPDPDPAHSDIDALTGLLALGNPAPYAGTIRLPEHGVEIATASPELYLSRAERTIASGPIKGTGRTEHDLLEKDHAENVMIVDLVRNDLGQACATGSVTVPDLCVVEKHPGLVHLVSTVEAPCAPAPAGPNSSPPPSRPARSPARPSPARSASSRSWRPPRADPTAALSAGSTPTATGPNSPSASARSGSTGADRRPPSCTSAPAPASPGAPTPRPSGPKPNSRPPAWSR